MGTSAKVDMGPNETVVWTDGFDDSIVLERSRYFIVWLDGGWILESLFHGGVPESDREALTKEGFEGTETDYTFVRDGAGWRVTQD